jgi:hypothetical protein
MEPHDEGEYMYMMQAEAYKYALWSEESARGYAEAEYNLNSYSSQIAEELANLEAGMESVKRNIDYYQNIYDNLEVSHNNLKGIVVPSFRQVKIPVGYETYMSDSDSLKVLLDKAIVEAYRSHSYHSDSEFTIMCNPDTFRQLMSDVMGKPVHSSESIIEMKAEGKILYKGMRVYRSYDIPENKFIVK